MGERMAIEDKDRAEMVEQAEQAKIEKSDIPQLDLNKKTGIPIKNNKNLATILREDKAISKVMAYNSFTYDIELIRDVEVSGVKFERGFVDETFTKAIMLYISETYGVDFSKNQIQDILEIVAKANAFNPVVDYLLMCEKNYKGSDPLNILTDYLGVKKSESVRLMTEIFFKGAISKVLYPHLPFDYTLDLVGDQGTGKSRFIKRLFDPFYTDNIESFKDKDDLSKMVKSWGIEDAEMVASIASGFDRTKKFITQVELIYRPPYAFKAIKVWKNFVICRTTNNSEHLRDATGDRRSLPIHVKKDIGYKKAMSELTPEALMEFWGGMMKLYRKQDGKIIEATQEQEELIEKSREQFKFKDEIAQVLEDYTNILLPENFYSLEPWERRAYIGAMLIDGVAYSDRERSVEIVGTMKRDRINTRDVIFECFERKEVTDKKLSTKIRNFYFNLGWEYKSVISFGKKKTSGYIIG